MTRIMKFMNDKTRGLLRKERSDEVALTSPRSLEDAEEMFQSSRRPSVFELDAIASAPIDSNGDIKQFEEEVYSTEAPTDQDYDFDHDSYYKPAKQVAEFSGSHPSILRQRSQSAQRPLQGNSRRRRSVTKESIRRRAASVGRAEHRRRKSVKTAEPSSNSDLHESGLSSKKRKSKMEKIMQLQEKNQRYKDEFRKVQKDRKSLKRSLDNKRAEAAALAKEVDAQAAESNVLKLKLSEALQQLGKTDVNERKDRDTITKLKGELGETKSSYQASLERLARMREEVEAMKLAANRKDNQIRALTSEVVQHQDTIGAMQTEIGGLKNSEAKSISEFQLQEKLAENENLKTELSTTLQRASTMVKEREEAISELLRENEEMKKQLESDTGDNNVIDEEILALRAELEETAKSLEQSQDRTVALEEEVEDWISKSQGIEIEVARLRLENEEWEQKRSSAVNALAVAKASAADSEGKATKLESDLVQAEKRHQEEIEEMERKHTEAILDQKEKIQKLMAESETDATPNPQEMMLQKAVADRKAKEGAGWGSVIQRVRGESKDALTPEARRIKELEGLLASQEEELMKTKSDMVKLKSTYNDTMYMNKKRIEDLETANRNLMEQMNSVHSKPEFPDLLPEVLKDQ